MNETSLFDPTAPNVATSKKLIGVVTIKAFLSSIKDNEKPSYVSRLAIQIHTITVNIGYIGRMV